MAGLWRLLAPGTWPALVCGGLLAACSGGDGSGLPGAEEPPTTDIAPLFSSLQSRVFTPTCATAGCHVGAGAPQGLRLDAANSYALLVDMASSEVPSLQRVAPGRPGDSYLVQKLEGTAAAGARMPLGRPPLARATIDVIRQWITDGATDDRAQSLANVRVLSMSPLPDSVLAATPDAIRAFFDRAVDVTTVNTATFIVSRSGGDGKFDNGNDVSLAAASIDTSLHGMRATFVLDGAPLPPDTYRVHLPGQGSSFIMDLEARALDGEFGGTFPSGNGRQGGDFVAYFTIVRPLAAERPADPAE